MAGLQGRVFGGYQLAEQLTSAGIAEVYRARPAKPGGREVVVKVIHPEFARMPGYIPRFREIVQASSKLASHPHILPLLTSGEESGYLYLVTPYVAAGTLKDWIGRGGRMGPGDAGPFFRQLCDALAYSHSLGVVHGDVKPSNVFLFEGRHVLLGDFGLLFDVAHLDMEHAGSGAEVVEYLAPEVLQGHPTQQSDIYSVGAVLFAAIAGQPPFRGARPSDIFNAHARQPVPPLAQAHHGLSPVMQALDPVIQRAMAKQPAQRFPSAAAVGQAIEAALRQAGPVPPAMPLAPSQAGGPQAFAQSPGVGQPIAPPAPAALGGIPNGFTALAPGQLGFGALMAADALGGIAGGAGGAGGAGAGVAPSIRPLGPQFPPLPASALVEESMEQGRVTVRSPDQSDFSASQAWGGVPQLPTMRMPASAADADPITAKATMRVAAPDPNVATGGLPAQDADESSARGGRGIFSLARKRSGLGKRLGQGAASLPPAVQIAGGDEDDGAPAQALPAIRGPQAPLDQAFPVVGGADQYRPAEPHDGDAPRDYSNWQGNAAWGASASTDGALSQELPAANWGAGLAGEGSNIFELGDVSSAMPLWGSAAEVGASLEHDADPQDFSPTGLGLPRLTNGVAGKPSTWQQILSGPVPAVRPPGRGGQGVAEHADSVAQPAWRSGTDAGGKRDWGEESAEWASQSAEAAAWGAESTSMPAQRSMSIDPWASVEAPIAPIRMPKGPTRDNRPSPEDDIELDYGGPKRRRRNDTFRRRPRWIRPVLTLLVLLTLVDAAALVVLRPDLCPNTTCQRISARARSYLAFLTPPAERPPSDMSAEPSTIKVSVAAGQTATAEIKVTNNTSAVVTWKATSTLSWVTFAPASGSLPAQSGAAMIVTVNASGIKAGAYTTTITITYGQQTLTIPASIDVAAS